MHETYTVQQGISLDFLSNLTLVNHRGKDYFFCLQFPKTYRWWRWQGQPPREWSSTRWKCHCQVLAPYTGSVASSGMCLFSWFAFSFAAQQSGKLLSSFFCSPLPFFAISGTGT